MDDNPKTKPLDYATPDQFRPRPPQVKGKTNWLLILPVVLFTVMILAFLAVFLLAQIRGAGQD